MKISYNWLKDYININIDPEKAADILTNIGLEVEGIEKFESIKGGLEGVFIGEVLTCIKHPNADKLLLANVDINRDKPLQIVCGAPNVQAGQKVPVATIGTTLYKGDESLTLKPTKIRGELSEGMICAEDELGLGNDHSGIMVLNKNTKPGTPAKEYFNIESDTIFEIGLTPNRTDAMCHFGVARDLAAFLSQKQDVILTKPSVDNFKTENNNYNIDVSIKNTNSCPRYSGVSVSGIKIKESPDWLKNKLKAIGLNPINNVVDITNFILHETGQPLHAFDADELADKKIVVKNLPEGTPFVTLDEIERKLSDEDLTICDGKKPVALAGVFGGLHSGVTENTTNVFIESAHFNPASTRRTAKRHQLSTDSSFRFERGVDPEGTIYAMKRAALLIKELAEGTVSSDIIDVYPLKIEREKVSLTYFNIQRLIGKNIGEQQINNILKSLEFEIKNKSKEGFDVIVPPYRYEVTREADVIEEILRIYGYNNIEISPTVLSTISHAKKPDPEKITNSVSDYLTANGFYEIISNSLTKSEYFENKNYFNKNTFVTIFNPLSTDLNIMRQSLLFGGLEAIAYNQNRKIQNIKLYEFGYIYKKNSSKNNNPHKQYIENKNLALFITGQRYEPNWITKNDNTSFYEIKTYIKNILDKFNLNENDFNTNTISNDLIQQGLEYIYQGKSICNFGMLNKKMQDYFNIDNQVFYGEIEWEILLTLTKNKKIEFIPLPKYPEVKRDLALLLDKKIKFNEIKHLAYKAEGKLLKQINLFDVYEGKNLGEGKKSYAVSFILQDENKTLTDKQIDKIMKKLILVYEKELNAQIR